jgi:hypothetical protein
VNVDQAKRLKGLERENIRLKKAIADKTLAKLILKKVAERNFLAQNDKRAVPQKYSKNCESPHSVSARY